MTSPPFPPPPPRWLWQPSDEEEASATVEKAFVRWAIWSTAPRGDGTEHRQAINDFLQRGHDCGWEVPVDVGDALRRWIESGAWRHQTFTDEVVITWFARSDGPGTTHVSGDVPARRVDGDVVEQERAAAEADGFTVVDDHREPGARRLRLTRPWRPPP